MREAALVGGVDQKNALTQEEPQTIEGASILFDEQMRDLHPLCALTPPRRYGTPTSEDWRNLSVHGDSTVRSDVVAEAVGDTVHYFGEDIENMVTDGLDRFGNPICGGPLDPEAARKRKRQRREDSPVPPTLLGKKISIRFRKHRDHDGEATLNARGGTETKGKTREVPDTLGLASKSAAEIRDDWIKSVSGTSLLSNGASLDSWALSPSPVTARKGVGRTVPSGVLAELELSPTPMDVDGERERPLGATWTMARTKGLDHLIPNAPSDVEGRILPQRGGAGPSRTDQVEVLPHCLVALTPPAEKWAGSGRDATRSWEAEPVVVAPATPGTDGYATTPPPKDGFPNIHHSHPEGLIEDLAMKRIDEAWRAGPDEVLFATVANIGYPEQNLRKLIHDEIRGLIEKVTGEKDFVPIAPQPEWVRPPGRTGAPKTWMILGLSKEAVRMLVAEKVLSCVWITLFLYERKLTIPRYLFTLTGFTTNHNDDIRASIRAAFNDDPIYSTILDLVQGHPGLQHLTPHDAAAQITASVEVRLDWLSNGNIQAAVQPNSDL
ncbi:hypothetical protein C2E23DRAFT_886176 [Lenzites betulinus]|nr:hypothetical protein C2E23DRAFT_886176 [Lenzites betulinus]